VAAGVQHDPTAQLTRIPSAGTGDNQAETSLRTNITSGTGSGGRSNYSPDASFKSPVDSS
jgi:hypothetical protein